MARRRGRGPAGRRWRRLEPGTPAGHAHEPSRSASSSSRRSGTRISRRSWPRRARPPPRRRSRSSSPGSSRGACWSTPRPCPGTTSASWSSSSTSPSSGASRRSVATSWPTRRTSSARRSPPSALRPRPSAPGRSRTRAPLPASSTSSSATPSARRFLLEDTSPEARVARVQAEARAGGARERRPDRARPLPRASREEGRAAVVRAGRHGRRDRGDARGIEHVLSNLVDNAVKYCPAGSASRCARPRRTRAPFVADTGFGIPPRRAPAAPLRAAPPRRRGACSEPGHRARPIVKHMVEAMRGTVTVESTVGKGRPSPCGSRRRRMEAARVDEEVTAEAALRRLRARKLDDREPRARRRSRWTAASFALYLTTIPSPGASRPGAAAPDAAVARSTVTGSSSCWRAATTISRITSSCSARLDHPSFELLGVASGRPGLRPGPVLRRAPPAPRRAGRGDRPGRGREPEGRAARRARAGGHRRGLRRERLERAGRAGVPRVARRGARGPGGGDGLEPLRRLGRWTSAALENLQLSAHAAPGLLAMDAITSRPLTVGKSMAIRRRDLARLGGFRPVGGVLAEDHALGRRFLDAGFAARTTLDPVENRNVGCSFARTERHTRWSKMRRSLFPRRVRLRAAHDAHRGRDRRIRGRPGQGTAAVCDDVRRTDAGGPPWRPCAPRRPDVMAVPAARGRPLVRRPWRAGPGVRDVNEAARHLFTMRGDRSSRSAAEVIEAGRHVNVT